MINLDEGRPDGQPRSVIQLESRLCEGCQSEVVGECSLPMFLPFGVGRRVNSRVFDSVKALMQLKAGDSTPSSFGLREKLPVSWV